MKPSHAGLLPVFPDPVEEGAESALGNVHPGPEPLPRPALCRGPDTHVTTLVQIPEQRHSDQRRDESDQRPIE